MKGLSEPPPPRGLVGFTVYVRIVLREKRSTVFYTAKAANMTAADGTSTMDDAEVHQAIGNPIATPRGDAIVTISNPATTTSSAAQTISCDNPPRRKSLLGIATDLYYEIRLRTSCEGVDLLDPEQAALARHPPPMNIISSFAI